jgi:hypothetical protein
MSAAVGPGKCPKQVHNSGSQSHKQKRTIHLLLNRTSLFAPNRLAFPFFREWPGGSENVSSRRVRESSRPVRYHRSRCDAVFLNWSTKVASRAGAWMDLSQAHLRRRDGAQEREGPAPRIRESVLLVRRDEDVAPRPDFRLAVLALHKHGGCADENGIRDYGIYRRAVGGRDDGSFAGG